MLTTIGLTWLLVLITGLIGCDRRLDDSYPITTLASNGFARPAGVRLADHGSRICVWGYVDRANLYGDPSARRWLGDWWSGLGPDKDTWRFDLLGHPDDAPGRGVPVHVPNDSGRDDLLRVLVAEVNADRSTRVRVCGRFLGTPAPTNLRTLTALTLRSRSSGDIRIER